MSIFQKAFRRNEHAGNQRMGYKQERFDSVYLTQESKKPALAGFFIISQRPIRLQLRLLQTDL